MCQPNQTIFMTIALVCVGCGVADDATAALDKTSASPIKPSVEPLVKIASTGEVYVIQDADQPEEPKAAVAKKTVVTQGELLTVQGSFQLSEEEDDSQPPPIVTIKVSAKGRDGHEVIHNSRSAPSEHVSGKRCKFNGQLKAPQLPGTYMLQAWRSKRLVTESRIDVK